jgi:hypothetical protein
MDAEQTSKTPQNTPHHDACSTPDIIHGIASSKGNQQNPNEKTQKTTIKNEGKKEK